MKRIAITVIFIFAQFGEQIIQHFLPLLFAFRETLIELVGCKVMLRVFLYAFLELSERNPLARKFQHAIPCIFGNERIAIINPATILKVVIADEAIVFSNKLIVTIRSEDVDMAGALVNDFDNGNTHSYHLSNSLQQTQYTFKHAMILSTVKVFVPMAEIPPRHFIFH